MPSELAGGDTLLLGDALDLLRTLERGSFGAVITDPPYSSGGAFRGDRTRNSGEKYTRAEVFDLDDFDGDTRDQRTYTLWSAEWMRQARTATRLGGVLVCFTDWRQLAATTDAVQMAGWVYRGLVTWTKPGGRPSAGLCTSQAEFAVVGSNGPAWWTTAEAPPYVGPVVSKSPPPMADRWHMTQKPVAVMAHVTRLAPPGEPILDPFCGSGSSLIAATASGRAAVGIEVNETQHATAARRLATEAAQPSLLGEETA